MPMAAEDIIALIKQGIPGAEVEMQDLAGDGDHWAATVISPAFAGKIEDPAAPDGLWRAGRPDGRRSPRAQADHHGAEALIALYSESNPWEFQT